MGGIILKKICSGVLAIILTLTFAAAAFAASPDTSYSAWAETYITDAENLGILPDSLKMCGYRQPITRNAFCEMAYETMGYMAGYISYYAALAEANAKGETDFFEKHGFGITRIYPAAAEGNSPFSDTDSTAIIALNEAGIILGRGNGKFAPDDTLTRQEAAAVLSRMAEYFDLQEFSFELAFSDADQISDWAADGVKTVCGMGVMVGMSDAVFSPAAAYTCEQAIATMIRLINSVPHLSSREEVSDGLYCTFNSMWMWVEDGERNVTFKLPLYWATYNYRSDYGYGGWRFFTHGGKILMAVWGKSDPSVLDYHTTLFELSTGKTLLSLPADAGLFYALDTGKSYIIMQKGVLGTEPGDWGTIQYGVYGFDGKEILATTHEWSDLYHAGYVNTEYSVNYLW
ncbi:MAG: S-layer homology domain-containing protein [Oscillospiraceae bacterium]|nr:S-layer homology domain-containing protein [Oscillospiraceae bacterium]